MIEIYNKNNLDFEANGDMTLEPTSCIYKSELNGAKELTLEHPLDELGRWKYIKEDNLIAVSKNNKKQFYRIYNKVKSLDSIVAYARPLFYDLIDTVLLDARPTDKKAEEALNIILQNTKFKGHSNISKLNTAYYIRKNIVEAITSNDENSFFNRWGGEIYLDNYDIYINDRIGTDRGVRIDFRYNLENVEEDINLDSVVTRIIPTGFDGIMLDGSTPWVDSPLINKYANIKTRVINFDDVKVKENLEDEEGFSTLAEAQVELKKRCTELYDGGIDKPTINYKINMVDLSQTTAYKDYKILESIFEGDPVTCYVNELNIEVQARCIFIERDELTGRIINLELGNFISNYFNQQSDITSRVNDILNSNGTVKAQSIEGTINALQTKFKAMKDIAQRQHVRAILFEDKDTNSPTFGCMCLGTMGFEIASSFKPGTTEWDFRTFGTGKGFVADCIITGLLVSRNGLSCLNLDNGEFNFGDKIKFEGNKFEIKNKNSSVIIDDSGQTINNGALTVTNGNGTVVIDGKYNMHKIVVSGVLKLTMEAGVTTRTATVAHNLNYKPCSSAYVELETEGKTYVYAFPYISYNNFSSSTLGMTALGRCWASDKLLEFIFIRASDSSNISETFTIRYYIYKEVAI